MLAFNNGIIYSKKGEFDIKDIDFIYTEWGKSMFLTQKRLIVGQNGKEILVDSSVKDGGFLEIIKHFEDIVEELEKDNKWIKLDSSTYINRRKVCRFSKYSGKEGQCYVLSFKGGNMLAKENIPYETRQIIKGEKILPGALKTPIIEPDER